MLSREMTLKLCKVRGEEMMRDLRRTNESWDDYHGVAHRISDESYAEGAKEIAAALFKRTGYGDTP